MVPGCGQSSLQRPQSNDRDLGLSHASRFDHRRVVRIMVNDKSVSRWKESTPMA